MPCVDFYVGFFIVSKNKNRLAQPGGIFVSIVYFAIR